MNDIKRVPEYINNKLKEQYSGGIFGDSPNFVQVGEKKWFFPERYQEYAEKYRNFKVRRSDIWMTGYPRSGTSMTADICWLLSHGIDFASAEQSAFNERSKLFELNTLFGGESNLVTDEKTKYTFKNLFQSLDEEDEPRVIKTHLPFELLPSDLLNCGAKVIYIVRNVKDMALSFYNLQNTPTRENFKGTFEDFWTNLENDHFPVSWLTLKLKQYVDRACVWRLFGLTVLSFNPYWKHIQQGLEQHSNKNVLIVFYEEQIGDLKQGIKKIADFVEVPLTDKQLFDLTEFFSFSNYKKVTHGKNFFNDNFEHVRKGEAGGWKKEFPDELKERADKWREDNIKSLNIDCQEFYKFL